MVDKKHKALLDQGVAAWNAWRAKCTDPHADLRGAHLRGLEAPRIALLRTWLEGSDLSPKKEAPPDGSGVRITKSNLRGARIAGSDLSDANLSEVDFSGAVFEHTSLTGANLTGADLRDARLHFADLSGANLTDTNLTGAKLTHTSLEHALLVNTDFGGSELKHCRVYGISVWDLKGVPAYQSGLVITPGTHPRITVDDLEVAQFVYLLLNNKKIRNVIDTVGKKGVLILGRFRGRLAVLEAISEELRRLDFVPIVFSFGKSDQRDFTETIITLAGLSRFVIADITQPRSSPLELQAIAPQYMVPVVPIIQAGEKPFSMFADLAKKYDWVLDPLEYDTKENLVKKLQEAVIEPALKRHEELVSKRGKKPGVRKLQDY